MSSATDESLIRPPNCIPSMNAAHAVEGLAVVFEVGLYREAKAALSGLGLLWLKYIADLHGLTELLNALDAL